MSAQRKERLPPQGSRTPSGRRGGGTVPASSSSTSSYGQSVEGVQCHAGLAPRSATAGGDGPPLRDARVVVERLLPGDVAKKGGKKKPETFDEGMSLDVDVQNGSLETLREVTAGRVYELKRLLMQAKRLGAAIPEIDMMTGPLETIFTGLVEVVKEGQKRHDELALLQRETAASLQTAQSELVATREELVAARGEMSAMREEIAEVKEAFSSLRTGSVDRGPEGGGASPPLSGAEIASIVDSRMEVFANHLLEILGRVMVPIAEHMRSAADRRETPVVDGGRAMAGEGVSPSRTSAPRAPPPVPKEQEWARVVGRKARGGRRVVPPPSVPPPSSQSGGEGNGPTTRTSPSSNMKKKARSRPTRAPAAEAVVVTVPSGDGSVGLAEVMARVKRDVSLKSLGIASVSFKRARTGGLIIEVPGSTGKEQADRLAAAMAAVLKGTGARVSRPAKSAEFRVAGLDDSTTEEEVRAAVVTAGQCSRGDVVVGRIRRSPSGIGVVWARGPVAVVRRLAEGGVLEVGGWASARVEVLEPRPPRCFKCLAAGHFAARCSSVVDRSNLCYRCSVPGHRAANCPSVRPRCPLCTDLGRSADHRLGAPACGSPPVSGRVSPPHVGIPGSGTGDAAELVATPAPDPVEVAVGRGEPMETEVVSGADPKRPAPPPEVCLAGTISGPASSKKRRRAAMPYSSSGPR